jgi:ABC-type transport system substrate-binding protein
MSKKLFAVVSFLMIAVFVLSACAPTPAATPDAPAATDAPVATDVPAPTDAPEATEPPMEEVMFEEQPFGENLPTAPTIDTPLVVAYQDFSQKFSPFFADTGYDQDVASMTQISVLTTDRTGGIIFNAIEGETVNFNGTDYLYKGPADIKVEYDEASDTTKYTARLRVGMKFSDGVPVTIDDLIFSYYTFLDPTYVGSTTLGSYDIIGLKDYQTQTTSEVFDKYAGILTRFTQLAPTTNGQMPMLGHRNNRKISGQDLFLLGQLTFKVLLITSWRITLMLMGKQSWA